MQTLRQEAVLQIKETVSEGKMVTFQENTIILNLYIPNNKAPRYRAKLIGLKGENTNPQFGGGIQYASFSC